MSSTFYPDSSLINVNNPLNGNYVTANSKVADVEGSLSFAFTDSIQYFISDADTIEQKLWDEVKAGNNYLKRYTFSRQDLELLNWTITYP